MRFKKIKGFERYAVSNTGIVINTKTKRKIKPAKCNVGYNRLCLSKNGKRYTKKVHRLVAEAFLDDYSEGLEVNHKDFNKLNNDVRNLEMMTHRENMQHAWEGGRFDKLKKN